MNLPVLTDQLRTTPADNGASERNLAAFLRLLFDLLDRHEIRYVVLHSYDDLPDGLPSDLDMAIDPDDVAELAAVFAGLEGAGYRVVQRLNYAPDGNYFVICWTQGITVQAVAVDFIQAHRRAGVYLASAEDLLDGRRRHRNFWIPAPEVEFQYLLAKKALKRDGVRASQQQRLRELCELLGRDKAEPIAARLFGPREAEKVVFSCLAGAPGETLESLRGKVRATAARRAGLETLRQVWMEVRRRIMRWWRPTGLFVAVLGPDGSGKSTLLDGLLSQMQGPFRRSRVFHWRPMLIAGGNGASNTAPHRQQARPAAASVLRACVHFADYWLGYWLCVRPALVRSTLALFDRYSYDAAIDPARYRFPESVRRFLNWMAQLTPKPDITLVLDTPPEVALARKRETEYEDAARLRARYLERALRDRRFHVLDAAQPAQEVAANATAELISFLSTRFARREKQSLTVATSHVSARARTWNEALRWLPRSRRRSRVGATHRYLAVPGAANPRLLLPLDAPRALHAGINAYAPWTLRAKTAKSLLHAASWAGVVHAAGDQIELDESYLLDIRELTREVTGVNDPVFALLPGTPGRRSNLTLKAMRRDGAELGFVKVPSTVEAVARVRHEAAVLRILGRNETLGGSIPQVLFAGEWGEGGYLLFQSVGAGKPGPTHFGRPHRDFLRALIATSSVSRNAKELVEETAVEWEQGPASAMDASWRSLARFSLEEAAAGLAGASVSCGIAHGDFAPWNARLSEGRLFVFDWEAAEWEAPACWDRFHFEIQVLSRLRRSGNLPPASAVEHAIRQPGLRPLLSLYLLRSAAGLVRDGVEPANRSFVVRRNLLIHLLGQAGRK